jgi:TetR/AcrR family transcriptional repressor of mexJK operon
VKDWTPDHPKAKLMARKRAAILAAAREVFLRLGYEGASMEAIAAAADVSIMTLYRHAESKEDLFAAVISMACDPSHEAEWNAVMKMPLRDILVVSGMFVQEKLANPATTALLRVVVAESTRFPELAETAYRGFVGHHEKMIEDLLEQKDEARGLGTAARRKLSVAFVDRLFGADMLRTLLGLNGTSTAEHRKRAERAAAETMAALAAALEGRRHPILA